ncbi:MAG: exodeoxyribonuclease-3 [Candidatus Krumholzibacteriia bacterium]|jgi:exodeoxyribonuclease-3
MRIVSWNVNGLRACLKKGFAEYVMADGADVFCLQEVRALPEQVEMELPGYTMHWNPALKRGYSGTAIITKKTPINVFPGLGDADHDTEGRVLTAEFEDLFLVTVYTPNSQRDLKRLDYRENRWDKDFLKFIRRLEKKKPVVFCGDLNVAHTEIDLANPKSNRRNAGFTDEERAGLDNVVKAGFIDTFREFEKGPDHYSWWSNRPGVRERNVGWRLDYFFISEVLRARLKSAKILASVMGSDHCPVDIKLS